jgi:flagellar hook-associated protein 3 FlgL
MGVKLLRDISTGDLSSARFTARDAKTALGQVMGALNVELSGRHLFAGAAAGAPLAGPEVLLSDMQTLFSPDLPGDPPLTVDQIMARVNAYFDPASTAANSFNERIWRGVATNQPPVELSDGEFLDYAIRGDAGPLRDMMRGLALAATTVQFFDPAADTPEITQMLDGAGKVVVKATDDITRLRSDLGLAEGRIEAAQSRTTAQRATLELARADLVGVDQYDAATRVNTLQNQLQAIYAMTARSSQLSLLNFIR